MSSTTTSRIRLSDVRPRGWSLTLQLFFACALAACSSSSATPPTNDAGSAATDAGGDASASNADGGDPMNAAPQCSSGQTWTLGDFGSASMHPGLTCVTCHQQHNGPALTIAGTVYPTAHEPDDCNGVNGGVSVVLTEADGTQVTLPVNNAGNFYLRGASVAFPYRAKVVGPNGTREMTDAQSDPDCNHCHTQSGASQAPGRIVAP